MIWTLNELRRLISEAGCPGELQACWVRDYWPSKPDTLGGDRFKAIMKISDDSGYEIYDVIYDGQLNVACRFATYSSIWCRVDEDSFDEHLRAMRDLMADNAVVTTIAGGGFYKRVERTHELIKQRLKASGRQFKGPLSGDCCRMYKVRGLGRLEFWDSHAADLLRVVRNDLSAEYGNRSRDVRVAMMTDDLESKVNEAIDLLFNGWL